jgi:hypothetical protein
LCSNSNPLTPVDLGQPAYPDPATANAAGSAALAQGYGRQPELDLRYPWVLTSNFNPMQMDGAGLNRVTECSCTWVNTIPLVSDGQAVASAQQQQQQQLYMPVFESLSCQT